MDRARIITPLLAIGLVAVARADEAHPVKVNPADTRAGQSVPAGATAADPPLPSPYVARCNPKLAPYLASINLLPTSASVAGALFAEDPISKANDALKAELVQHGFTYTLYQSFGMAATPRRTADPATTGVWAAQGFGFLEVFDNSAAGGSAAWVSTEINWVLPLGGTVEEANPANRVGTVLQPDGLITGDGFWIAETAWQQSFLDGTLIVSAGMIDQQNYIDVNTFANNQFTQLTNGSFVNSEVLVAPAQGVGFNIAWQPCNAFYAIYGTFPTNSAPGSAPFANLSSDNWGNQFEFGIVTPDFLGLGENIFRAQPFIATVDGVTSGGVGFNIEQSFGSDAPLGWFGRFGVCNPSVSVEGFATQISTGFALEAPSAAPTEIAAVSDRWAFGFVWGRPVEDGAYLPDEYGAELIYALQITPTMTLRPDLQFLWGGAYDGSPNPAVVLQLQATIVW